MIESVGSLRNHAQFTVNLGTVCCNTGEQLALVRLLGLHVSAYRISSLTPMR